MKHLLFFIFLLVSRPNLVSACTCMPADDMQTSYNPASVIFKGKVVRIDTLRVIDSLNIYQPDGSTKTYYRQTGMIKVSFKINKVFKGPKSLKHETIYTTYECCICGFPFYKDRIYLVYGYNETATFSKKNELVESQEEVANMRAKPEPIIATSICTRITMDWKSGIKEIKSFLKRKQSPAE
jgi:hypothetical protein